jgi:hypothetical protein
MTAAHLSPVSVRPWASSDRTNPSRDDVGATALAPPLATARAWKTKKGVGPEAGSSAFGGGPILGAIREDRGQQRELGGGTSDQVRLPESEHHLRKLTTCKS